MAQIQHLAALCTVLLLAGCNTPDWIGGDEEDAPLEGRRISVLAHRTALKQDMAMQTIAVQLPSVQTNKHWNLQRTAAVLHPALSSSLDTSNSVSAVDGADDDAPELTSAPIVADGKIFTLGADGVISTRNAGAIDQVIWEASLPQEEETSDMFGFGIIERTGKKPFLGGNIAYAKGRLYLAATHGQIAAFNAKSGEVVWSQSLNLPIKSSPIIHDGRLFVITSSNRLYALDSGNGNMLWTHSGVAETTSMHGAPSPAVQDNIVVVPYSSGEVHALDTTTGKVIWSDVLGTATYRKHSSIVLSDISANPVISHGKVYVVSHDGVLVALDLATGNRLWTQDIASTQTPWVAGNFLFIFTSDYQLVCVHTPDGKIKWISEFPTHTIARIAWSDGEKGDKITWSGPILAQERLLVAGSHGKLSIISPYSGKEMGTIDIPEETFLPPVVANKTLYILSNDGELMATR